MPNLQIFRASAGSGKTHTLTQSYLKLAFADLPDIKEDMTFAAILAVTFTNKAAEEMKERIIKELNSIVVLGSKAAHYQAVKEVIPAFSEAEIQEKAQHILSNLLHNYSKFSVSTIDSFVQKIVRAFSFEIGMQSGYKIEMDYAKVVSDICEIFYRQIAKNKKMLGWLIKFVEDKMEQGKGWDFKKDISKLSYEIFKERYQQFVNKTDKGDTLQKLDILFKELKNTKYGFDSQMREIAQKAQNTLNQYAINKDDNGRNFATICNYLTNKILKYEYEPNKTVINAIDVEENWYAKSAKNDVIQNIRAVYSKLNNLLEQAVNLFNNNYNDYLAAKLVLKNFYAFAVLTDIAELLPKYRSDNNLMLISDTTLILKQLIDNNETHFI